MDFIWSETLYTIFFKKDSTIAKKDKLQFGVLFYTSLRASAHTGVAIPTDRGCMGYLKGIPTPVCGLVREDVKINHPDKLKFIAAWGNVYKILWIFPIYMV